MSESTYPLPEPLITTSPDCLDGHACFTGVRVPVQAMFDYLKSGYTPERFLEDYPGVSRAHAVAVLEQANEKLLAPVAGE